MPSFCIETATLAPSLPRMGPPEGLSARFGLTPIKAIGKGTGAYV